MERSQKEVLIGSVRQKFERMSSAVFLDFKGMNVEAVTKLRDEFRKSGVEYRVVKNTLVRHAIKEHPWAKTLSKSLTGMTGVAWSYEDPSAAAKVVKAFRKDNQKLQIKAGLIEGQILSGDAVETQLATMPGKDELRATLLATLQAPLQQFVQQLNAPLQNFAYLLKAKEEEAGKQA
ncbi:MULTISPECIES: 50S ribosomal protein L10 [Sorangium]|uniref:Large ribosomal subunit protein uL10 n=2 Tax=Sorangium TaxID=39643 RepID=RL10_SORC5|nr:MULTISPECIES: 50S ribosomal protein L10 [Sorangium]A9GRA5.1 RecName: Full=Large ribosomal subunit protein uL10; AltName: Full=50S ribosomal protein L10 [Sorangium cellulosum So ce56]MDC0680487.1 50S ribosomal protein L10 [Sorangium aterium]CAN90565.1 50S ribosomal protein L10 [Sorangium cellulosum So ce56]